MRQIGLNIFSLGLSRIVSGIIIFIVYVRLVTYLGPQDFGRFSLVLAYYTIFLLLMDLGISKYVTKRVSEDRSAAPVYLGNFLILQFFAGLLILATFIVIPRLAGYDPEVSRSMLLVGFGLLLGSQSLPFLAIVHAWQRLDVAAAVNFVGTLLNALWLALAIWLKQDLLFIFWVYVVLGAFYIVVYLAVTKPMAWPRLQVRASLLKELLLFGLPFLLIAGFEVLIQKIDIVIQKVFLPFAEVGIYAAAYRFVDFLTFIPAVVALSLFPVLAETKDLRLLGVREALNRLNRYLMTLAVPLGVGGVILAEKIILTLFDQEYAGAGGIFRILIWASALTFVYAVPNVIMLVKKPKTMVLILGLTVLFNVAANWIFVPRYGIFASAWITVLSYILVAGSYTFFSRKEAEFKLISYGGWPLAAAAIMGIVIWQLQNAVNIFVLLPLSAALYLGVLFAAGFLRREDLRYLSSILRRQPSA